jgi:hypothetical protein
MAIGKHLSDNNPDGTVFGQSSTDKIGFYGLATPIVRPTITLIATATATTTLNEKKINRTNAALVALGIFTIA